MFIAESCLSLEYCLAHSVVWGAGDKSDQFFSVVRSEIPDRSDKNGHSDRHLIRDL